MDSFVMEPSRFGVPYPRPPERRVLGAEAGFRVSDPCPRSRRTTPKKRGLLLHYSHGGSGKPCEK